MRLALSCILLLAATLQAQPLPADALLDAARTGDRAKVVALLDSGVSVNTTNKYGVSALGFAAERGHFDIARLLVERGADVNVVDSFYGSRPVDFALRGGHLNIAVYLLEHKSPGAVSVLNTAIRRRDAAAVKIALATKQADAAALASASTLAAQSGDAAIAAMVKAAADATPAVPPKVIALTPALLRSYEGNYQSASTGAVVKIALRWIATDAGGGRATDASAATDRGAAVHRRGRAGDQRAAGRPRRHHRTAVDRSRLVDGPLRTRRFWRCDISGARSRQRQVSAQAAAARTDPEVPRSAPINWPSFRGRQRLRRCGWTGRGRRLGCR